MSGWLVPAERRRLAADRYHAGNQPEKILPIEAVVIHYTGSVSTAPTVKWLTALDENYVSAHFVIARDGTIHQLVPVDERAFHAGGPTSRLHGRTNVNGRTIGIELMNIGFLLDAPDGSKQTPSGIPYRGLSIELPVTPLHPVTARPLPSRFWEPYQESQLVALVDLTRRLVGLFPDVGRDLEHCLVGHDELDPSRKMDPGPAFPWADYRKRVGI